MNFPANTFGVVCFTGHRPQDTPAKFNRFHTWKLDRIKLLEKYLIENPPNVIISGMAIGWDQWGAYTAIKLGIPLHAYVPHIDQEKIWSADHQKQYRRLLNKAECVKIVCEGGYAAWKMQRRNESMLADAEGVLALYNVAKQHGGTFNTVCAAHSMNKPIINFWGDSPEILQPFK